MEFNQFIFLIVYICIFLFIFGRYEYFDFYYECRKMRWDRLLLLIDRFGEDVKRFGYEFFFGNMVDKILRFNMISLYMYVQKFYNECYVLFFYS